MKPKTKLQKEIVALSKRMHHISEQQKRWAYKHCFEHLALYNKKGEISCLECGHQWQDKQTVNKNVGRCVCPLCGTELTFQNTPKRTFKQVEYVCILTMCGSYQVLRFCYLERRLKKGEKVKSFCEEVVRRWIAPNGKYVTMAMLRPLFGWGDSWCWSSKLEIRPEKELYDIMPTAVYSRAKLMPQVVRNGFKGDFHNLTPFEMIHSILTDNRAESLLKMGQYSLLRCFVRAKRKITDMYWNSIRICSRNGYIVADGAMWCDYLGLLDFFNKDLQSPKYLCPVDLKGQHDRYVAKKHAYFEKKRQEEQLRMVGESEEQFREMKAKFFGITFSDGTIHVRVLESVREYYEEGKCLKHCVFTNEYFEKSDSLVLSACIEGKRIETVEVSLETLKVIQCQGLSNTNSEYHDRIVDLVNKNISVIRQRLTA